jgi:autotransporter-associated beta strand protein
VDIYDTATGLWSTASLSQARDDLSATTAGGKVFFAGGRTQGVYSNVVDIYDTATGLWSTASLSQARNGLSATSAGNKVLFGGGWTGSVYSNVVDIYTLQNYGTITSSAAFTLVDQTTVAGRMQLNAPGSLDLGTYNLAVGSMSGVAPINLGSQTLTVGSDGTSADYSGAISGSGSVTKTGTNTQILVGTGIAHTGRTTVLDGTLTLWDTTAFASDILNGATTEFEVTAGTWTLDEALGGAGTFVKSGGGTLVIAGLQDYDPGALFDVLGGTMVLDTDAGSAGADLSISVLGAELYFGCDQHLDTLEIGDGGKVVFAGAQVVVLNHLVMDGVDLGATTMTPEPATLALVALGGLGILARRRRKW